MLKDLRHRLKRSVESATGVRVYRSTKVHGLDAFDDLKKLSVSINTVIDVGANEGQFAASCREAFPNATIYSFEPLPAAFAMLRRNQGSSERAFNSAVGESVGEAKLYTQELTTTSSLVPRSACESVVTVPITTLEEICRAEEIERVDLLKIDTEGFEMPVLRGAKGLLASRRVGAVYVEVGFREGDDHHTPFITVQEHLASHGFMLLGLYNQSPEWNGQPSLLFADACFVLTERLPN